MEVDGSLFLKKDGIEEITDGLLKFQKARSTLGRFKIQQHHHTWKPIRAYY